MDKIDLFKEIAFFWTQGLSGNEFKIVVWLLCNTVGRGNDRGSYSLAQINDGIPKQAIENDWWCAGVGMSMSSIRRALQSLQERGVISKLGRTGRGTTYMVNLDWVVSKRP